MTRVTSGPILLGVHFGQSDPEGCPLAHCALHTDLPAMSFDDFFDERQPQSYARRTELCIRRQRRPNALNRFLPTVVR